MNRSISLVISALVISASASADVPQPLRANAHDDPNPVAKKHPKRVAIVVANPTTSASTGWPVGFWWSELTHPYFLFSEKGYEVEIFSYFGGKVEGDAMSNPDDN